MKKKEKNYKSINKIFWEIPSFLSWTKKAYVDNYFLILSAENDRQNAPRAHAKYIHLIVVWDKITLQILWSICLHFACCFFVYIICLSSVCTLHAVFIAHQFCSITLCTLLTQIYINFFCWYFWSSKLEQKPCKNCVYINWLSNWNKMHAIHEHLKIITKEPSKLNDNHLIYKFFSGYFLIYFTILIYSIVLTWKLWL